MAVHSQNANLHKTLKIPDPYLFKASTNPNANQLKSLNNANLLKPQTPRNVTLKTLKTPTLETLETLPAQSLTPPPRLWACDPELTAPVPWPHQCRAEPCDWEGARWVSMFVQGSWAPVQETESGCRTATWCATYVPAASRQYQGLHIYPKYPIHIIMMLRRLKNQHACKKCFACWQTACFQWKDESCMW